MRPFRRLARIVLVLILVQLLTVDVASAWCRATTYYYCPPPCHVVYVCPPPTSCWVPCTPTAPAPSTGQAATDQPHDVAKQPASPPATETSPSVGEELPVQQEPDIAESSSDPPANEEPATFIEEPAAQPVTVPEDTEVPVETKPADPPIEPEDGSVDDLFAEPDSTPAAGDDAPLEAPAGEPAFEEPPADDSVDDLFGEPEPESDTPVTEEPAAEPPADSVDDLFGEADESAPAKEEPASDELFGAPDGDALEGKAGDDKPGEAEPSDAEESDDLFGDSDDDSEPAADDEMEKEEEVKEDDTKKDDSEKSDGDDESLDDLFQGTDSKPRDILAVQSHQPADAMRTWTDNTGQYQVRGKLHTMQSHHVRILKENGRFTTVPFSRLSRNDVDFVNFHASKKQGRQNSLFITSY